MALAALAFAARRSPRTRRSSPPQMGAAEHDDPPDHSSTDDPTAHARVLVPAGHGANLGRPPARRSDGSTRRPPPATSAARRCRSAARSRRAPRAGRITVERRAGPARRGGQALHRHGDARRVLGAAASRRPDSTIEVPMFVDPGSGALAVAASYSLTVCLPPSDIPESNPAAPRSARRCSRRTSRSRASSRRPSGQKRWGLSRRRTAREGHAEHCRRRSSRSASRPGASRSADKRV